MSEKTLLTDEQLENVGGGLLNFNQEAGTMTWYKTEDGASIFNCETATYSVSNHDRAYSLSNQWHSAGYTETEIINGLIKRELIKLIE